MTLLGFTAPYRADVSIIGTHYLADRRAVPISQEETRVANRAPRSDSSKHSASAESEIGVTVEAHNHTWDAIP